MPADEETEVGGRAHARPRLHDLRHAAVSQLISQGASILLVARVAGHSTPDLTLRVYSHLLERDLAEAAVKYDPLRDVMFRWAVDGVPVNRLVERN